MSGTPPYTYLSIGESLTSLGVNELQYLYSGNVNSIVIGGVDLFESGCIGIIAQEQIDQYPLGVYNIAFPYCRTALKYNMSDTRGDPQIGQLVPQAPNIAAKIILDGCDLSLPVSISFDAQPTQSGSCVATILPGHDPATFYLFIDSVNAELPMRVYFTVTNGVGKTKQFWIGIRSKRDGLASGAVVPARQMMSLEPLAPPVNILAPSVIAPTIVEPGSLLSVSPGNWRNDPTEYRHRWLIDGVTVAIGDLVNFIVPNTAVGQFITAEVTASNAAGASAVMASNVVGPVQEVVSEFPPVNVVLPHIDYSAPITVGSTLIMMPGSWLNDPVSFVYEWRLDDDVIIGATGPIFVVPPEQVGKIITASVTAVNLAGSTTVDASEPIGPIVDTPPEEPTEPPVNIAAPAINYSSPVRSGDTITVSSGSWDGLPHTFSYEWLLNGVVVPGATSPIFVVPVLSGDKLISAVVTATNNIGSSSIDASNTVTVAPDKTAPVNTLLPLVSPASSILVGQTLTVSDGGWTGDPISYAYAWFIDSGLVDGATSRTFDIPASAVGKMISARVTANNTTGSTSAFSANSVGPIQHPPVAVAPSNTTPPRLTFTSPVKPGDLITSDTGAWAGSMPMTFVYAWRLDGIVVSGATTSNFIVPAGSEGKTVTSSVVATNSVGSAAAISLNSAGPITNVPVNTSLPVIAPATDLQFAEVILSNNGGWINNPTTFTYQWAYVITPMEEGAPITYSPILGHTSSQHAISTADHNKILVCLVRANNIAGSSVVAISNVTEQINLSPVNIVRPTVSYTGGLDVGTVFTVNNGIWTGAPITSYNYQWRRDSTDIPGATATSYTAVVADIGTMLRCRVVANTAVASASVLSQPAVGPIAGTPDPPISPYVKVYPFIGLSRPAAQIVSNPSYSSTNPNMYDATMNDQTFDLRGKPTFIQHTPGQGPATAVTLRTARSGTVITGFRIDTTNPDYYTLSWDQAYGSEWGSDKGFRFHDNVDYVVIEGVTMRGAFDGLGPHVDWPAIGHVHKVNGIYADWIVDDFVQNDNLRWWELYNFFVATHQFWSARPGSESTVTPDGHTDIIKHGFVHLQRQWYDTDRKGKPPEPNCKYTQDWIRGAGAANYTVNNSTSYKGRVGGGLFKRDVAIDSCRLDIEGVMFRVDGVPASGDSMMTFPPGSYKDCALLWLGPGAYPYKSGLPSSGVTLFEGIGGGQTKDDLFDMWMEQSQIWFNANGNPSRGFNSFPWSHK